MLKYLLLIVFCWTWLSADAQFNDTTNYRLVFSSTGSINGTNEGTAYLLNNKVNMSLKKKSFVLNMNNTWLYGKQNHALTNNDFSSSLNFNLYKTIPHFYYWGLLDYNTSFSLKLKSQMLAGLGIAYSILDRENTYLNVSNGILYDNSNLISSKKYETYRNSFRLQYHFLIGKMISIGGSNFFQQSFVDGKDYIIKCNNSLDIKLKDWISLTTTLTYNKLNVTNSQNVNLTYGLTIDKYF